MAKYKRYQGEFIAVDGVRWRAEIWQEADATFTVGALEFDADEPLTIEWSRRAKEEVICGATATLKIISPGDRTYADLYSVDVNRVRLDVYRNGSLYWSGAMDTEFYEEPYEALSGYVVSLTFTDFGVWDRLKYDLTGMQTIGDIIDNAITRSGFMCGGVDASLVSTKLDASTLLTLGAVKVNSGNFYDEDGEASTLAEVIKGALQPLALRIVQRAGAVRIYDLNALFTNATREPIEWDGDSQTMGVDSVYNNAKVTWSPYAQSDNLLPDTCWPEDIKTSPNSIALNNIDGKTVGDATYYTYSQLVDTEEWDDAFSAGFTLWTSPRGNNISMIDSRARFFKIVPQNDGTEAEGVAIYWRAVSGGLRSDGFGGLEYYYANKEYGVNSLIGDIGSGGPILKSREIWVPPVDTPRNLLIHLKLELLMDVRFNPFESAANIKEGPKQKDNAAKFDKYGNYIYLPVRIRFKPEGSNDVYTWDNQTILNNRAYPSNIGEWVKGDGIGYLAYYDTSDLENKSGVLGWRANRQAISPTSINLTTQLMNAEDGQSIQYPLNGGGQLWVEVYNDGWRIFDARDYFDTTPSDKKSLYPYVYWTLLKLPELKIINAKYYDQAISTDDVEYSAELNAAAKEEIALNTICGTSAEGVPTARGAYYRADNNAQIKKLTRAGRTTQAEDLLIGTLYSQYAQRRTSLSGETTLLANAVAAYTEANQEGKVFIALEDIQDLRAGVSNATFVEIRPDEYKRNNE